MKSRNFFNAVRKKSSFFGRRKETAATKALLTCRKKKQEDLSKKRKKRVLPSPFYFQWPLVGLSATYEHCFPKKKKSKKLSLLEARERYGWEEERRRGGVGSA